MDEIEQKLAAPLKRLDDDLWEVCTKHMEKYNTSERHIAQALADLANRFQKDINNRLFGQYSGGIL